VVQETEGEIGQMRVSVVPP